ncbi:MAG: pyridoxal phosphate-dependent aminotransferase [gamma proteobacterium symbiont of Bathyaustriella thionipta]|nr:pyridoxal phosphate-dependent aminotransferase [gamma proteobacterium symbiont of Bathyaustriella thionipta]MCU7950820.1 pyridoxal phosphate-dependent aminotransferase [gamma proteobacterium symbiont of Bathyaustriella thionipta]MCU7952395.1 pyridoxal phosphate-dependent aminotransferase [gamma proteobacterium symbiont of Bathyaustriella thionipta]MCU7957330.1 pyridoxal phosphate-dependent aminotransferase [gamma proteobacterium symbiont of Bathyaustriella thionipta]MCU7968424.1 pyridoxal ph
MHKSKITLSDRVQSIKPSATLVITAKAKALKAEGKAIIGLGAGEPDFDTPEHIKDAAIKAINDGFTKYTAVGGTPELKQAICDKFKRDNSLTYTPDQVLVSSGGKQSFYNLCQAFLNDGDEVIIPAPYWVSYPDMVILAGAQPFILSTGIEEGFKISPTQLKAAITEKTRLVVLNTPSNPTGVAYTRADLKAIGEVLKDYPDIIIASDDMYEHIVWADEPFCTIAEVCPELYDQTLTMNGVSKAYSMTGWRIGYAAGPAVLIAAMTKIQSQSTSNPCSISQAATLEALNGNQSCIDTMLTAFKERHDYVVAAVNAIADMQALPSQGAFYTFVDMQAIIEQTEAINDDVELADYILSKAEVALVPGSAFGAPGYMRISFATSMENLQEAMKRLEHLFS